MEPFCSLYVGDLHPSVTEGQLIETFSKIEGYISAMLCQDNMTGRSLCYGYVNFLGKDTALQAIDLMNHKSMNGKAIRVMWSQRDSETRNSGIGNIFVKNLDSSIDNFKLQEIFSKYGNVLTCKVALSPEGKSNGYGFVLFDSEESANNAIQVANGTIINGKEIYVARFIKKSERQANSEANYTNLYVKNLDAEVSEDQFREKFSVFGEITSLVILRDENGISKGYGFVDFANSSDAIRAKESMDGTRLGSKVIFVSRAQKKSERQQNLRLQFQEIRKEILQKSKGLNVYVKHISDDVDDIQLKDYFNQCGTITSAKIMRDEKGRSKGFGFVCFSTFEESNTAIKTLNGVKFHDKPLYVAIAQTRDERKAFLQTLHAKNYHAGLIGPYNAPSYPNFMHQSPWRPHVFLPPVGPGFVPPAFPMTPGFQQQYRDRMNRHMLNPHGPFLPQHNQLDHFSKRSAYQQRVENGKNVHKSYRTSMSTTNSFTSSDLLINSSTKMQIQNETLDLSSKLAAASVEERKVMLGQQLFPLVKELRGDLAAKITGMLLELDNAELLVLLESPKSLAAKVEEAAQMLALDTSKET